MDNGHSIPAPRMQHHRDDSSQSLGLRANRTLVSCKVAWAGRIAGSAAIATQHLPWRKRGSSCAHVGVETLLTAANDASVTAIVVDPCLMWESGLHAEFKAASKLARVALVSSENPARCLGPHLGWLAKSTTVSWATTDPLSDVAIDPIAANAGDWERYYDARRSPRNESSPLVTVAISNCDTTFTPRMLLAKRIRWRLEARGFRQRVGFLGACFDAPSASGLGGHVTEKNGAAQPVRFRPGI